MERHEIHVARLGAAILATLLVALPTGAQPAPSLQPAGEKAPKEKAAPEPVTRLEVTVRDDGGEPLEGALVVALPSSGGYASFGIDPEKLRTTVTGSEGRATLESLPPGPWTVTVQARGFAPKTERRVETGPLEVRLDRGGVITGVVADAEGVPLAGARVSLDTGLPLPSAWAAEASRVETTTDADGRFRLEGIGSRPVTVAARAPGFGRATREDVAAGSHVELFLFPGASLGGTVVDGEGHPVDGALVQAAGGGPWSTPPPSERTDAEGRFVMAGVEDGAYVVLAREGGRAPGLASAVVEGETEASVEISLTEGGYVTGRLLDGEGQPLEGRVEVAVFEGLGIPDLFHDRFASDARSGGRFVLGPLPLGDLELKVSAPGHAPERREAWVPGDGATVDLGDVVLGRGLSIRGRVVDEEGLGLVDAQVRARAQIPGVNRVPEARSDVEGRFEVSGLTEGPWEVEASAPGFATARARARAGDQGLELALESGGEITGRVVDADGQPVPEARIHAEPADGPSSPRVRQWIFTNAETEDGQFVLRDLAAGSWVLQVSAPGKGEASLTGVEVSGGRATDVGAVRLSRGGVIRGRVVDTSGTGVPGATVQTEHDGRLRTQPLRAQSGSGGAFEIRGVPPGPLAVFARHPSFAPSERQVVEVDPELEPEPVRLVLSRGGRIEGQALHRDGRPFTGGQVMAWGLGGDRRFVDPDGTPVGPDGWFAVDHVPPGRTQVNLMATTSSNPHMVGPMQTMTGVASHEVEVKEAVNTVVDFQLRDVIVAGQVTRGGQPAPGLRVTLRGQSSAAFGFVGPAASRPVDPSGPPPLTAVTREDGRYELMVYTPGQYQALLSEPGGQSFPPREADVPDVELYELNLEVADSQVSGVVVSAETGEALTSGHVSLSDQSSETWVAGGPVGPDGRFVVAVEAGDYRLIAQAEGYTRHSQPVSVGASGVDGLVVEMEKGLEIVGRVVDAVGRPAGGLTVTASAGERSGSHFTTLPDGTFRLDGLEDRGHTLVAGAELLGFAVRRGVRPGDDPVTLRLGPGGRVAVTVRDAGGRPVADAWPWVRGIGGARVSVPGLRSAPTDAAGRAEMSVPAGPLEIEVRTEKVRGSGAVTVREGETASLEIVLHPNE